MSTYGIFENKKNNKKLVFYPCAKNANTSAKLFFLKHLGIENKFIFLSDKIPKYKQTKNQFLGKKNLNLFLSVKKPFSIINADYKCCIIRHPIDRFLSAYKNRILFHKDKKFGDHTIDMILKKLENGLFENRHFLPQTYFLGDSLNYYTFYSDLKNIKYFEEKVNEFFGKKIEFPKLQIGGKEFDIKLSTQQINKIEKIYAKDFKLIK
jgi:hypothetical protein